MESSSGIGSQITADGTKCSESSRTDLDGGNAAATDNMYMVTATGAIDLGDVTDGT